MIPPVLVNADPRHASAHARNLWPGVPQHTRAFSVCIVVVSAVSGTSVSGLPLFAFVFYLAGSTLMRCRETPVWMRGQPRSKEYRTRKPSSFDVIYLWLSAACGMIEERLVLFVLFLNGRRNQRAADPGDNVFI